MIGRIEARIDRLNATLGKAILELQEASNVGLTEETPELCLRITGIVGDSEQAYRVWQVRDTIAADVLAPLASPAV